MIDKKKPLFMISVVAEMFGIHPQTLRLYEREGFLRPTRVKRLRLYSQEDVERIRMILRLTKEMGVNRAGVDIILRMRQRLDAMHRKMEEMMNYLENDIRKKFEEQIKKAFFEE
ncbi:MAG TPA: MerR family transcriptional regulator [Nitrospiraceae bacterium]|nr:MerR family transcriptional regulator [Nitrospiraceae bacterium]